MQSKRELLSAVRNATANKTRRLGAGDVAMLASAVEALTASDENINDEEVHTQGEAHCLTVCMYVIAHVYASVYHSIVALLVRQGTACWMWWMTSSLLMKAFWKKQVKLQIPPISRWQSAHICAHIRTVRTHRYYACVQYIICLVCVRILPAMPVIVACLCYSVMFLFTFTFRIVRVFDKIAQMTNLTNGRLQIRKRNFLMEVRETRLQSISDEGFTPDFAANSSTKAVLPKSLFRSLNLGATDNIRVSSSVIEKGTLFKGRNASVAVTCAIISLSVVGQEVSNLQEPIVLTFKNEVCTYI